MPIVPTLNTQQTVSNFELEEAKTWVFNNSAKFEQSELDFEKKLNTSIDPVEYARDPRNSDRDNPESYTNQIKGFIDDSLQEYTPPNKAAEDLWSAYTNKYKEQSLTKAIVAESAINMNGRKTILTNTINDYSKLIETDPDMFQIKQNQTMFALEGAESYISTNTKFELQEKATKDYKLAYMKGTAKQSPMKLMDEILSGAHSSVSKKEEEKLYMTAFNNYVVQSRENIKQLNEFVSNELAKIHMGEASSIETLTMEDYYTDDLVMQMAALTPWFGKNMIDKTRRTSRGESQRTESVTFEGTAYLYPTIRWDVNGNEIQGIDDYFFYALKQGDALAVKDEKQATRISKQMSRMLSYGD
tara:strand:- start:8396 stop:9469 length:1074 start_codon:yes stop_codon:yes gene_type:complete